MLHQANEDLLPRLASRKLPLGKYLAIKICPTKLLGF